MTHPLMEKVKAMYEADRDQPALDDYSHMLFDLAVVAEGGKLDNPARFSRMVGDAMAKALEN